MDNRKQQKNVELASYLKLIITIIVVFLIGLYFKNNKVTENINNYSKINIGEPDF